ncbi:MAG: hypothetical protein HYR91_13910 [Flavobacteriia bacterium]|nr:hypothetical protein [Flavobacteriia bacterium]
MKNIVLGLFTIGLLSNVSAQEAADKKIQAGLVFGAGMNMLKPGTKMFSKNGVGSDLTIGMNMNYSFSPTIALNTGIEFDFESIKYKSNSTSLNYYFNDTEILTKANYINSDGVYTPTGTYYQISERKMKPIYLTIPTMFVFRTKFIGYFRYFGKFGVRNSFLLSNTIQDQGSIYDGVNKVSSQNKDMHSSARDLSIYKGAIGVTGGAEWNFSGTTCLVAEIGYYYGFVDVNRGKSVIGDAEKNMTTFTSYNTSAVPSGFTALPFKQNQILFKLSILF